MSICHVKWLARRAIAPAFAGPAIACSIIAGAALAQPLTAPEEAPARETEELRAAGRAAAAARVRPDIDAPPVTYADVMRNPDDLDLNYRWARTQVSQGDLKGAAATLERILLINPGLAQVRLFYGVVLFRLDNIDEAEREFNAVLRLPMPDSLRAEIEGYLQQIELRRKRTRWTAALTIGGQYDTNRTAAPSSKTRRAFDTIGMTDGAESDAAALLIGSLRVRHDLGYQEKHELFGSVVYFHNEQKDVQEQDLAAFSGEAGGIWRTRIGDFSPSLTANHLRLNRESFLRSHGLRLRFDHRFNDLTDLYVENHFQNQDFMAVRSLANGRPTAATAPERSGNRNDTEIGALFTLSPLHQIGVSLRHTEKWAKEDYHAYYGDELTVRHTWLLGKGQFLLSSISGAVHRYDEPDPLVSARTRRDEILRARVTYGAPLATLSPVELHPALADITLTLTGEMFRAYSNLENYTYKNLRGQVLLTKRWDF